MALSSKLVPRLMHAVTDMGLGAELVDAINKGAAQASQDAFVIPALIVATNVSQTIDFGALAVGDKVVVIPAAAGNSHFVTVATAGTLGEAAVVGSLYIVLRPFVADAATSTTLL